MAQPIHTNYVTGYREIPYKYNWQYVFAQTRAIEIVIDRKLYNPNFISKLNFLPAPN